MALVFSDGFDHYADVDMLTKWTTLANTVLGTNMLLSPKWARPPGGQGLRFTGGNTAYTVVKTLPSTYATFVCGFAVYFETFSSLWIAFQDTGTTQLDLRTDASGHLVLTRNGTTLATSTNSFSLSTWYHIELKATINNTTGAYEVKVNGTSVNWIPSATSQNTRGSANNYINSIALVNGVTFRMDDLYLLDTTGSVANDFIGAQKIITVYPNGAGNYAQWTGNYASNFANVNESSGDSDGTFNQSSTAAQKDTFTFDDIPSGTVSAIQHNIMVRQDAGAQRVVRPTTRISSTDYSGTSYNTAGSYLYLTEPRSISPATSAAWTSTELNGAEFGYELVS